MTPRKRPQDRRSNATRAPVADPLAEMVRAAGLGDPVRIALQQVLARHLVEDCYAKLEQAGDTEEDGIRLGRVFIDLPTEGRSQEGAPQERGFVAELLAREPGPLGAEPVKMMEMAASRAQETMCSGFVLVGGPGQGKSTVGQLACQAHRAALIEPHRDLLTAQERMVLHDFSDPEAVKRLGVPAHPSFPIRIVLPDAAEWLNDQDPKGAASTDSTPALLRFWCSLLPKSAQEVLDPSVVLAVLRAGPFLLVFDGLDEVPAASVRNQVLSAIRELGGALIGTRGLIVGTTRPQGYSGELDGLGHALETRVLAPLSLESALEYARRLFEARIPDETEQKRALRRMQEASKDETTRRLMTTPLQVTILAALLKKGGRPPRDRWSLFDRYYGVMYAREEAKPTETAELLSIHRDHVRKIHARVGLLLQVESEGRDHTKALVSRERLAEIIDAVLSDEGFGAADRPKLIDRMITAATNRLVFLVQPQEGRFGFEIRSLQEFMAASALAEKSEAATKKRLLHVAGAGTFRNVTLFLAGNLLSEPGDLRDVPAREVCPALEQDPSNSLARIARAGSLLALEILEDGAPLSQPKRAADLLAIALRLLDLGPSRFLVRLVGFLTSEETPATTALEPVLRDALQARLATVPQPSGIGAWLVLLRLLNARDVRFEWAEALADAAWPGKISAQRAILEAAIRHQNAEVHSHPLVWGQWVIERAVASLDSFPPQMVAAIPTWDWRHANTSSGTANQELLKYFNWSRLEQIPRKSARASATFFYIRSAKPREDLQRLLSKIPVSSDWRFFRVIAPFEADPNAATLAQALRDLATLSPEELEWVKNRAPWPLHWALSLARTSDEIIALSERAQAGFLGDAPSWIEAESCWLREGVDMEDLFASTMTDVGTWVGEKFLRAPSIFALPLGVFWYPFASSKRAARILWDRIVAEPSRSQILAEYFGTFSRIAIGPLFATAPLEMLASLVPQMKQCRTDVLADLMTSSLDRDSLAVTLDQWGQARPRIARYSKLSSLVPSLARMYSQNPSLQGLLYFLAELVWGSSDIPQISMQLLLRDRFDNPLVRGDAWLIRMANGEIPDNDFSLFWVDMREAAAREKRWFSKLAGIVLTAWADWGLKQQVLASLREATAGTEEASYILEVMTDLLGALPSDLQDPETWARLELPKPLPLIETAEVPTKPTGPDINAPPVVLEKLALQNIRSLEHLPLDLDPPRPEEGQWTVLLGENGTGKSTVLRALVFGLRNTSDIQIWPDPKRTFEPAWQRMGMNPATETAKITVQLANKSVFETTIHKNGKEVFRQSPERSASDPSPCLLWAYGCRRGSALSGKDPNVDLSETGGPDIATLFDEGASLIHAEAWLRQLQVRAIGPEKERDAGILETVFSTLRTILDLSDIAFDADANVVVSGDGIGTRVPLAGLSDGYLTTTGWLVDLIARWIERARHANIPIGKDFPSKMTGLVLLDEIDLHLHPRWQLRVISSVRRIFRRLSFVVTTHNPLTLVGARPEEIRILVRTPEGGIRAEKHGEIPMTLTAGQLLASFFGIEDLYPDLKGAGRMLQRYGFLCGNPYRSDEEQSEMEGLRVELAKLDIHPGWTEVTRAPIGDSSESDEPSPRAAPKRAHKSPAKKPRAPRSKPS